MEYKRKDRVGDLLHQEISQLLIKGVKDPRIGFVTITGVEVSDDLKEAKVYYSVIGTDEEKKAAEIGLKSSAGFIRKELRKVLALRHIPNLHFRFDSSLEYGARIERILREVKVEEEVKEDD
ncbi:MAG: 30S ribosome-binding factor RbfA [Deltaproteobacteria bacterium]|nr:30S ribosome-binding factor RbfA [Deltaproteobacteria bacterium]